MKIKKGLRLIRILFLLIFQLIKNYPMLNQNLEHNFIICKRICQKILRAAGVHLAASGNENLPDTPFLLVSNHRCFFDVVILLAVVDKPIRFVAAKELYRYPFLRKYLASIQCVPIERYTRDFSKIKGSIGEISRALEKSNLVLFPEGECSYGKKKMSSFKRGGFMGVTGKDIWIVPCFLHINSFEHVGRWMIPDGEVRVVMGKAFRPEEAENENVSGAPSGALAVYARKQVRRLQEEVEN
ncbi:MAG: 1-acyl-sn-glycerol-3-phosphate acyltransferase [Lachnospiraceae bacterium]|nr:1-acyl-sn-glycerol-3-phosphate acyltransferase [Lachnospiraceae bacterium]